MVVESISINMISGKCPYRLRKVPLLYSYINVRPRYDSSLQRRGNSACEKNLQSNIAKEEYGPILDDFVAYSSKQPGTHVSAVSKAMVDCLTAFRPLSSYKIGPDSKAAPFVGLLPTGLREFLTLKSIYGRVGSNW